MSRESRFEIFYRDDYACLTVYPAEDERQGVYLEDVVGRLKILDIRGARQQSIIDAIEEASGIPVPLVKWPQGRKLGPVISHSVAEDRLSCSVVIEPEKPGGEPLSVGMLRRYLESSGIVHGVDDGILSTLVLKKIYNQSVRVAVGTPPIDERAAVPEYLFITDRGKPFRELEFQRIDLKELNFIQNRKKGDLLAELHKPQPPADGMDVYGKKLPAKRGAVPIRFEAGEGAVLSDDGKRISAATDGNARLEREKVIVEPLISVEDVDYSNGNMEFDGSIDIKGRIADGFIVKASGDIQIGKSVSRVNIAAGGDVILKAGITGNDEGIIVCEGDLYARYIESANILCKGSIYVEEAIMHSSVKAGGDIILSGRRAEIFGGRIFAAGRISCKKIGSVNEPLTELFLGTSLDSFTAVEALQQTVSNHSRRVDEVDLGIRQIKNALNNQAQDVAPEKLKTALEQLQHESEVQNEKLSLALRELHELKKSIELTESSVLEAEQEIFGKVHVYFNHLRWDSPGKGTGRTLLVVKKGKLLEK